MGQKEHDSETPLKLCERWQQLDGLCLELRRG
jgi:hypothetical protein